MLSDFKRNGLQKDYSRCNDCQRPSALRSASFKGYLDVVKFLVQEEKWYIDDTDLMDEYTKRENKE